MALLGQLSGFLGVVTLLFLPFDEISGVFKLLRLLLQGLNLGLQVLFLDCDVGDVDDLNSLQGLLR